MKRANMDWVVMAQEGFDNPQRVTPAEVYPGNMFFYLTFSPDLRFVLPASCVRIDDTLPAVIENYQDSCFILNEPIDPKQLN